MSKIVDKLLHPKKTKFFWIYIFLGVIGLVAGIMLTPLWLEAGDWCFFKYWGVDLISLIIGIILVCYILFFLAKQVKGKKNSVIVVLTIIEIILMALIAIGCAFQQFNVITVGGACQIFGLALWCRGVIEIFRAYFHQDGNNEKYPIWLLVLAIALVSFGVYCYIKPLIDDIIILWIFVSILILLSIVLIVDGVLSKPEKKEKIKKSKTANKS